jgi:CheY-like chemotaxis protein
MHVTSQHAPDQKIVLVVESDVLVRMVVAEFLRGCGYRVVEAAGVDEAIVILQRSGLPIRIVLAAAAAQRSKQSFALSRWIRANKPGVEIILAGGVARTVDAAARLCESGPTPKSGERDAVLARVQRLTASRRRPAPAGARAEPGRQRLIAAR